MTCLVRITVDVFIAEQPLLGSFVAAPGQPDDDHMDVGLATCVRAPSKGAVGKGDLQPAALEKQGPQLSDLLTLGN